MPRKLALIVDDSATAQHRLKAMLADYDLEVRTADSGEEALLFLDSSVPDVIFLDHQMPGMDGFRALQTIKSHPETAVIPVIMYTSKGGDVYTGQARALGALDVVSKDSFTATELSRVLKMIHIEPTTVVAHAAAPAPHTPPAAVSAPLPPHNPPPRPARHAPLPPEIAQAFDASLNRLEKAQDDKLNTLAIRLVKEIQALKLRDARLESLERSARGTYQEILKRQPAPAGWWDRFVLPLFVLLGLAIVLGAGLHYMRAELLAVRSELGSLQQTNETLHTAVKAAARAPASTVSTPDAYLQDMAWAFNQGAGMDYHSDTPDPRTLSRLREWLGRLAKSGMVGRVELGVSIGDFCTVSSGQGLRALPPEGAKLGDCILTSKLDRLDRIQAMYAKEISALSPANAPIALIVRPLATTTPYPELNARTAAQEWNTAARRNHRLEVRLLPGTADPTPRDAAKP